MLNICFIKVAIMGICPNMKKIFFSNFETKKSFSVSEKKIV